MKLKELTQEELETMSFSELAEVILNDSGKALKIVDVFKKICKVLKMSDAEFENKVVDFFELVSTDKNFIVLDKGFVDLRKKHTPKLIIEDDDEEISETETIEDDEEIIEEENPETDIYYDNSSDEDDVEDNEDELNDFIVVDEDETSM